MKVSGGVDPKAGEAGRRCLPFAIAIFTGTCLEGSTLEAVADFDGSRTEGVRGVETDLDTARVIDLTRRPRSMTMSRDWWEGSPKVFG